MGISDDVIFYICQSIACTLSAITCFLVLVLYACSKSLKIYSFRLVFHLTLHNFIRSITLLIPADISEVNSWACGLIAYLFYAASLSSTVWTFLIALNLYQVMFLKSWELQRRFWVYLCVSTVFPYTLCIIPLFFGAYGQTEMNCLLKNDQNGEIFRFGLYYFPAFLVIIGCLFMYVKIFKVFKNEVLDTEGKRDITRLLYFPLVLIVCVLPALIYRIFEYAGYSNFYWFLLMSFFWSLQGFLDVVVYALSKPVIRYMKVNFTEQSMVDTKSFSAYLSN